MQMIELFLVLCLLGIVIETMITFRKNKKNLTEKVKESLIQRFYIITGLSIIMVIFNFINIFIK
jgi:hypothetical protein